ncbi:MAG: hypothetical protein NTU62_07040 [Spirochaetes bacterium]|nr:hypothetical protein [Spirochaetota bacterium]
MGDGLEKLLGTLGDGKLAEPNWNGMYHSFPFPTSPALMEFSEMAKLTSVPYCLKRAT